MASVVVTNPILLGWIASRGGHVRAAGQRPASGATAVQIVRKRGRRVPGIEHIGSAHTDDEFAVLLRIADERRHAGQLALDLDDSRAKRRPARPP